MKWKQIPATVTISAVTTPGRNLGYAKFTGNNNGMQASKPVPFPPIIQSMPASWTVITARYQPGLYNSGRSGNPGSCCSSNKTNAKQVNNNIRRVPANPFSDFFDDDMINQLLAGAGYHPRTKSQRFGVIISEDGYIVTNNHVVDKC